ncbi:MAG: protein-L-isoaspartate O-methyltransferase [Polaromonas sp.]|nr:protein-L-isoaspartate O-methyltransferase [Polaromonas sp.]
MSTMQAVQTAPAFDVDKARFNMIEQQVRPWDVADSVVLGLLKDIPREVFTPEAYQSLAFADLDLPLSSPAVDGECMLPPKVQARVAQDLAVQPSDKVLHIGTGSGFMAALLGRQAQQVLSLEINPALAKTAAANLQRAGITNVNVRCADAAAHGFKACADEARYDVVVVSGSLAEVPQALLDMLKVGGRFFAFVGDEPIMRATLVTRASDSAFTTEQPWDYVAPRMKNFPRPSAFRF